MHLLPNGSIIICNLLVPVPLLVLLLSGKDLYDGEYGNHNCPCYHDDVYTFLYLECSDRTLLVVDTVGIFYMFGCLFYYFCGKAQSYRFVRTKKLYIILLHYDESRCREFAADRQFRMIINGCVIVKRDIILLRLKV